MPSFTFDVSDLAQEYIKANIKDMSGNAGQETLVNDLVIDTTAILTVDIAGDQVQTEAVGNVYFSSAHPEAIELIIKAGEDHFEEFLDGISKESLGAYEGLNLLETIRELKIDEAFSSL